MSRPPRDAARALGLALRIAGELGGGERSALVALRSWRGGHTRFARNEVVQAAELERRELTVTLGWGQRRATASTNQLDADAIAEVVARAARLVALAPENALALPPLGAQRYAAAPGAVDPELARAGAATRAAAVAAALAHGRGAGVAVAGFFEHGVVASSLASSLGLSAHHEVSEARYSCSARTADGSGSGWSGAVSHRLADLEVERHPGAAIAGARASARPRRLDPGRYTVILEPAASAALLRFVTDALDARSADEGRSYFSRPGGAGARVGERLFPEAITVRSDPRDLAAGGRPFDEEGLAQRAATWIDRGTLVALPYDRSWARQRGAVASGVPGGVSIAAGPAGREALLRGVVRGLLISRLFYLGLTDPQRLTATGSTRDGVFLIENGAIAGPVNNFRFLHSAADALARCDGVGASEVVLVDGGSRLRAPLLRTHDFLFTARSAAV